MMVGSTAAPPLSSHQQCPTGIIDGEVLPPRPDVPPSPTAARVSSPSSVEISAQDHLQLQDRLIRVKVEEVSEDVNVQTQGGVGGELQGRKEERRKLQRKIQNKKVSSEKNQDPSQGVSLPSTSTRPTSSNRPSLPSKKKGTQPTANDNLLTVPQKGPANAVPKKRPKTPIVQVVTMVVSGTLYPTAHLYFHELWKIHLTLEREATNGEAAIRSMVVVMHTKFMKYWKLSYLTICLPVILDPRYKLKFLEMCLKTGLDDEFAKNFARVEKTFEDLFTQYSTQEDGSTMENDQGTSTTSTIDNPWERWNKQVQLEQQNRGKLNELNIYLKDAVHPQKDGFDILCWWSTNEHKYPIISRIAKDLLAAPVSTVASESAFSTGGRIISDYRSNLLPGTVEALICLQDWMRPLGIPHLNTITSDVIDAKRADIYESSEDIFDD